MLTRQVEAQSEKNNYRRKKLQIIRECIQNGNRHLVFFLSCKHLINFIALQFISLERFNQKNRFVKQITNTGLKILSICFPIFMCK